jgi:hypothetical protein
MDKTKVIVKYKDSGKENCKEEYFSNHAVYEGSKITEEVKEKYNLTTGFTFETELGLYVF